MRRSTGEDHDHVDPAEALMREVGAQLRQVRMERGEDLEDVAQYLRIKPTYLFGIEQGDLSVMPGRTYALGFLRSYADYLGFDGDDLIVRIKSTVAELTDKTRYTIRAPLPENRLPKAPILVVSLALLAGVYAGWSFFNDRGEPTAEPVEPVPDALRQLVPAPRPDGDAVELGAREAEDQGRAVPQGGAAQGSAGPATETAASAAPDGSRQMGPETREPAEARAASTQPTERAEPDGGVAEGVSAVEPEAGSEPMVEARAAQPTTIAAAQAEAAPRAAVSGLGETPRRAAEVDGDEALQGEQASNAGSPVAILAALAPVDGAPAGTPPVYDTDNVDARVIIRARSTSWIRISSPDGDYLRSRTLEPGAAVLVPNRADVELWTGNAGGLELLVDGAPLPALGREGQVLRNISLDPERLLATAARQP